LEVQVSTTQARQLEFALAQPAPPSRGAGFRFDEQALVEVQVLKPD
jgi:hypothetical protein